MSPITPLKETNLSVTREGTNSSYFYIKTTKYWYTKANRYVHQHAKQVLVMKAAHNNDTKD